MHARIKPESSKGNDEAGVLSIPPTDRLVGQSSYVHRFDRHPCLLMLIRTYETALGKRYALTFYEPYQGL